MLTEHAIWGEVPRGFSKITAEPHCRLIVRADKVEQITASVCLSGGEAGAGRFQGREPLRSLHLPNGDTALIRTYRHGGIFRHCSGGIFCSWPPRPFRELVITEEIRRRGVPTVETYGACIKQIWGPFYRGWLVTREIAGAENLWQAFKSGSVQELGIEPILRAVAGSLRALHREGVYHSDLNLKNILIGRDKEGVKGYIIDFDKAKLILGKLPPELARRNIKRLLRSVNKLDPTRTHFSPAYWDQFVSLYYGAA